METFGSSYNAPRLHVAIEARKIVISGEVAGLQIQLGAPAFPGRFDSCDLPPKFSYHPQRFYFISIVITFRIKEKTINLALTAATVLLHF